MQGINVDIVLNMHVQLNVCVCECLCACVTAGGSLHVVTGVRMRLYEATVSVLPK